MVRDQVDTLMKTHKINHPVTRMNVMDICKHLNLRITHMQSIEAILHCRGKLMEASPEEDYSYDKLITFLQQKIKVMPPLDMAKPFHTLGLRKPVSQSTTNRIAPSLAHATRKMNIRMATSATISQYPDTRGGRRDPRSFVIAEREASRGAAYRAAHSSRLSATCDRRELVGSTDLPIIKTTAKLRKELDQDKYFH